MFIIIHNLLLPRCAKLYLRPGIVIAYKAQAQAQAQALAVDRSSAILRLSLMAASYLGVQ